MSTAALWFERAQSIGHRSRQRLATIRERHAARRRAGRPALIGPLERRILLAHSPIVLPYVTNFASTSDTNGDSYTATTLQGQGNDGSTGGWVNETGETYTTVPTYTVKSGGGVTLRSADQAPVGGVSQWTDVYNANLADHPSATK